jgi:hypothetical protein
MVPRAEVSVHRLQGWSTESGIVHLCHDLIRYFAYSVQRLHKHGLSDLFRVQARKARVYDARMFASYLHCHINQYLHCS